MLYTCRYQQTLHTTYISVTDLMSTKPTYHLHMCDKTSYHNSSFTDLSQLCYKYATDLTDLLQVCHRLFLYGKRYNSCNYNKIQLCRILLLDIIILPCMGLWLHCVHVAIPCNDVLYSMKRYINIHNCLIYWITLQAHTTVTSVQALYSFFKRCTLFIYSNSYTL